MSEERELRDLLEATQERLQLAEARLGEVERARALAAQRAQELELIASNEKQRIAILEEQVRLGQKDVAAETLAQMKARLETLELRITQTQAVSPRLPPGGVCSRCGSSMVIPNADVAGAQSPVVSLYAVIERDPNAMIFKDPMTSKLSIAVCGSCGYVEMTAAGAHHLWAAYAKARQG